MYEVLCFNSLLARNVPLIAAQRGFWSLDCPENSVEALQAAIDARCDLVTIDLRRSRDGQLVAFSDPDLARMTAMRGPVAGLAASSLTKLALRGGQGGASSTGRSYLPLLSEILATSKDRIALVLRLAELSDFALVARMVRDADMVQQVAVGADLARPASLERFVDAARVHGLIAAPSLSMVDNTEDEVLAELLRVKPPMVELRELPSDRIGAMIKRLAREGITLQLALRAQSRPETACSEVAL